jgi:hypothetical protein
MSTAHEGLVSLATTEALAAAWFEMHFLLSRLREAHVITRRVL